MLAICCVKGQKRKAELNPQVVLLHLSVSIITNASLFSKTFRLKSLLMMFNDAFGKQIDNLSVTRATICLLFGAVYDSRIRIRAQS